VINRRSKVISNFAAILATNLSLYCETLFVLH
jgi:hypothetical protein